MLNIFGDIYRFSVLGILAFLKCKKTILSVSIQWNIEINLTWIKYNEYKNSEHFIEVVRQTIIWVTISKIIVKILHKKINENYERRNHNLSYFNFNSVNLAL